MNSGERIKYMRMRKNLTQRELATLSGVSIPSIKKYENNRSNPQREQIVKLAEALDISPYALNTEDVPFFEVKTVGDLMGLLIYLISINFLSIDGIRGADGLITQDSFRIIFSSNISYMLSGDSNDEIVPLNRIKLVLKNNFDLLNYLIQWENIVNENNKSIVKYRDSTEKHIIDYFKKMKYDIGLIEMLLMKSNILLTTDNSIHVKVPMDMKRKK